MTSARPQVEVYLQLIRGFFSQETRQTSAIGAIPGRNHVSCALENTFRRRKPRPHIPGKGIQTPMALGVPLNHLSHEVDLDQ